MIPRRLSSVQRGKRRTRGESTTEVKVGEDVKEQNV